MADRYWVGGTGTWNTTNTASWATTSGGSGGASIPTTADNVFFDANSNVGTGVFTVTVGANSSCANLTFSGMDGTCTFGGAFSLTVAGNLALQATNLTWSFNSTMTFTGTGSHTIDWAGKAPNHQVTINSAGGTYTLQSAQTPTSGSGRLTVTQGTFTTNNNNIRADQFLSTGTLTRAINLGSSTVSFVGTVGRLTFSGSNLTFDAGTSNISITSSTAAATIINAPGYTFYNITVATSASDYSNSTEFFPLTCNNLSITSSSGSAPAQMPVIFNGGSYTINGTFTAAGVSHRNRLQLRQNRIASTDQISVNANAVALSYVDFLGFAAITRSVPWTGTELGNLGYNNTGITFDTPRTVYWRGITGTSHADAATSAFSLASGGAVSTDAYPLPQDTVVVNQDTLATTITTGSLGTQLFLAVGGLDFTNRTTAITFTINQSDLLFTGSAASFKLSSAVTMGTPVDNIEVWADLLEVTSAGVTIRATNWIIRQGISGSPIATTKLLDNTTFGTTSTADNLQIASGRFDCNGKDFNCFMFTVANTSQVPARKTELYMNGGNFYVNPRSTDVTQINFTSSENYYQEPNSWIQITGGTGNRTMTINTQTASLTSYTSYGIDGMPSFKLTNTANYLKFNIGNKYLGQWDGSLSTQSPGYGFDTDNLDVFGTFKHSANVVHDSVTTRCLLRGTENKTFEFDLGVTTLTVPLTIQRTAGTYKTLRDISTATSRGFLHRGGGFDLNGKTLTIGHTTSDFASTSTRTLTMNGGTISSSIATLSFDGSGFSCSDPSTGKISITAASTILPSSVAGSKLPKLEIATGSQVIVEGGSGGNAAFYDITNTVTPARVTHRGTRTVTYDFFNLRGTAGNLVTLDRSSTGAFVLSKSSGIVDCDYLTISNSTAQGGASWYAGANSTDGTGNTGWIFTAAVRTLTGNSVSQSAFSGTGAITQVASGITLTGNNVTQNSVSGTGAIVVTRTLTGNNATQDAISGTGAISQAQVLQAAATTQTAASGTGSITQTHILLGNNATQNAASTTGAIAVVRTLLGNNVAQSAVSGTGSIVQIHILTGASVIQNPSSGTGAIAQIRNLLGNNVSQSAVSGTGAVFPGQVYTGNNVTQNASSGTGAIAVIIIENAPAGAGYPPLDLTGVQYTRPQQNKFTRPKQEAYVRSQTITRKRT